MEKNLFSNFLLILATLLLFNYYVSKRYSDVSSETLERGKGYSVVAKPEFFEPLKREIDFVDQKLTKEELQEVETERYLLTFSSYGGVLSSLSLKGRTGKDGKPLKTVYQKDLDNREDGCFLLAIDQRTPFIYKFVSKKELSDRLEIVYSVQHDGWSIEKLYSVYKNVHKIDLTLSFRKLQSVEPIEVRLVLPAPQTAQVPYDYESGISWSSKSKKMEFIQSNEEQNFWPMPQLFGLQSKYFLHVSLEDGSNFIHRSYFKKGSSGLLTAIYEGVKINKDARYKLSFYMGPKDVQDMAAVDERLEGALSFGWFSWFCKMLIYLLEWLFKHVGNYGLAIILLALLVRAAFFPLTVVSAPMVERYQKYAPQINKIRTKYRHDSQMQQQESERFFKEHNISPAAPVLGIASSLLEIPVFVSLYRVLGSYMDLYNAPFALWIEDLSAKDPYYVLPLMMCLTMIWSMRKMSPSSKNDQAMGLFMPIVISAVSVSFASGLVLYWVARNLLGVGETVLRRKLFAK